MAHNEQVFTPKPIVNLILDEMGYVDYNSIRFKYIIDNSCGDGAFLKEIVRRYVVVCKNKGVMDCLILEELTKYVIGIEIDAKLVEKTVANLDEVLAEYEFYDSEGKKYKDLHLDWSVYNEDSLSGKVLDKMRNKMDYVVGNPPYCNVHHLGDKYNAVKAFSFASEGASELYLAFYNVGLEMLKNEAKMAYITPNSWMKGVMGRNFRNHLKETGILSKIIQLGGEKVFDNATTFTAITILDKKKQTKDFVYSFGNSKECHASDLNEAMMNDGLYLTQDLEKIRNIKSFNKKDKLFFVKNGFATLKDKLFVIKEGIERNNNIIKVFKASTGEEHSIIYPYDKYGKPLEFEKLERNVREMLLSRANAMEIDTNQSDWYLYGRTQALNDVRKKKIAISTIIKEVSDIKLRFVDSYEGVYSGLYIYADDDRCLPDVKEIVCSQDFIDYVKVLGKYKNGGYYTFSSKDLEDYLNYVYYYKFVVNNL